jgi:hypothetical protein
VKIFPVGYPSEQPTGVRADWIAGPEQNKFSRHNNDNKK